MQTIYLDISNKGVIPTIYAKQGDVGRKFRIVFTESGVTYEIPDNAVFSVWYSGDSGYGNYTEVGDREAITVNKNEVIVELITQMLTNPGNGTLCLILFSSDGQQLGSWNISYTVEEVPGIESPAAEQYYTALSEVATKAAESAVIAKQAVNYVDSKFKGKAGLIYPLATNEIPEGFLLCDGAEYRRTDYAELFEAIGTTYGTGDGETTFNVPNLQTRVPVGAGNNYELGATGGEEKHTLTIDEMPRHRHAERIGWDGIASDKNTLGINGNPITHHGNGVGVVGVDRLEDGGTTTGEAGDGQPHNIMQPYTVVNYIISTGKEIEFVVGGPIEGGSSVELDTTLTQEGKAADSKAVGDALDSIRVALDETIDDATVGGKAWSSKNIVDKLCPAFEENGSVVTCEPVEGYPLGVSSTISDNVSERSEINLYHCGKNLLDEENLTVQSGYYTDTNGSFSGANATYVRFSTFTNIRPNTTYTLSCNLTIYSIWFWQQGVGGISRLSGGHKNAVTFTTPENCDDLRISLDNTSGAADTVAFEWAQIELGDTATEHEPYHGKVYTADLSGVDVVDGGRYDWDTGVYDDGGLIYQHNLDDDSFTEVGSSSDIENGIYVPKRVRNIPAYRGVNTLLSDCGETTVTGKADPVAILDKLTNAIIALGGNV